MLAAPHTPQTFAKLLMPVLFVLFVEPAAAHDKPRDRPGQGPPGAAPLPKLAQGKRAALWLATTRSSSSSTANLDHSHAAPALPQHPPPPGAGAEL